MQIERPDDVWTALAAPECHALQTRRRNLHIRRFRHIFAVDPDFAVDPVHPVSRPKLREFRRVATGGHFCTVCVVYGDSSPVRRAPRSRAGAPLS
jgi:hypothetical protein